MDRLKTKRKDNRKEASIYRLNISYLSEIKFGKFQILGKDVKRELNLSPKLDQLKAQILELLMKNQKHRGLQSYSIAWQTHQSNGLAHLDILLRYNKNVKKSESSFNYLLSICPQDLVCFTQKQGQKSQVHITSYSATRLNQAILEYGQKEDPVPLSNFKPEDSSRFLELAAIRADPYGYLQLIMDEDPYNFDLSYYVKKYNLARQVRGWSSVKTKLTDIQAAARALTQQKKPGIKTITRQLIQQRLTPEELNIFDKYLCFQTIVDHLNQIPQYGPNRR